MDNDEMAEIAFLAVVISLFAFYAVGCGFKTYRTPCEVTASIRLEKDANAAHQTCRDKMKSCPDDGCEFKDTKQAAGCAEIGVNPKLGKIVVTDSDFVIAHEIRHLWDAWCLE